MALSPPSLHFLPGLSSPPVCHSCSAPGLKSSHLSLYPGALRGPSSSSDLPPELWASIQQSSLIILWDKAPIISVLILDSPPTSRTPNCHSTSRPESWRGSRTFTESTSIHPRPSVADFPNSLFPGEQPGLVMRLPSLSPRF